MEKRDSHLLKSMVLTRQQFQNQKNMPVRFLKYQKSNKTNKGLTDAEEKEKKAKLPKARQPFTEILTLLIAPMNMMRHIQLRACWQSQ